MNIAKMVVGAAVALATFAGPAAQAGQAPDRGCTAVPAAGCTYVASERGGVIGWGDFDVTIERGRRVITYSNTNRSLIPTRPSLQIRPGDRVTLTARLTWIIQGPCVAGVPSGSFVRAGSESYLLGAAA